MKAEGGLSPQTSNLLQRPLGIEARRLSNLGNSFTLNKEESRMAFIYALVQSLKVARELKREEGQALAEYGLIVALISVVAISALTALGLAVSGKLDEITAAFG